MKTHMRRTVRGKFTGRDLGSGAWHLTTGAACGPEIYLTGAEPNAAQALRGANLSAVDVEWGNDEVLLTVIFAESTRSLKVRHAIIHEPLPRLYDGLALESFDTSARRFWRRIFRLVRVPGGRHLLGLIARRARGPR
jgi:hypothetical protein